MKSLRMYNNMEIKITLMHISEQLGNSVLLVNSVCGTQIPMIIDEEMVHKMSVDFNTVYSSQILFK